MIPYCNFSWLIRIRALDNWLEMVLKQKQARQQFDFHSKFEQAVPTHPKFIAIVEAFKEANLKVEKAQAAALEAGEEIARLTFKKLALKPIVEVQRIQEIRERYRLRHLRSRLWMQPRRQQKKKRRSGEKES